MQPNGKRCLSQGDVSSFVCRTGARWRNDVRAFDDACRERSSGKVAFRFVCGIRWLDLSPIGIAVLAA